MKINVSYETVNEMLDLCSQLKDNKEKFTRSSLEKLLSHQDYMVEFARYQDRVSREEFIDFFTNFFNLDYTSIEKEDFRVHYHNYKYLFNHLDLYKKECKKLNKYTLKDFESQARLALKGLPDGYTLPDLNFIFTISIGMSFGWVYENYSHFDVIQLIKNYDLEDFMSVIAHEIHHIGMNEIHEALNYNQLPLEQLFYLAFSGEGLAVKYCNNARGVLSRPVYEGRINLGLDDFSWQYLAGDFTNTFAKFKEHLELIRRGEISRKELMKEIIFKYWIKAHTEDQAESDTPKLKQFRLYSFGNEIWGVIHDVFGKEKVFETLHNLDKFPEVYNQAVKSIGIKEYTI